MRVALIAGVLGKGGAEKQLVYMASALKRGGVDVRVYSLTRGEHYEEELRARGIVPQWVGRSVNPFVRSGRLTRSFLSFRPHIVQSVHTFANHYAATAGRLVGAISIGAVRSDLSFTSSENGLWTPLLFRLPSALIANSTNACREIRARWWGASLSIHLLPNVIELTSFDSQMEVTARRSYQAPRVVYVGRLSPEKRVDNFLRAFALARESCPELTATIIGDGPDRPAIQSLASTLGLIDGQLEYLGLRDDVPAQLARSDMQVLCSDHEGFPNVLLEGMAAGLPIVTTAAGDADVVVSDGITGFVVPCGDVEGMAGRLTQLARDCLLRRRLGAAGRTRVRDHYSVTGLASRLLAIYRAVALDQRNASVLSCLPT